MRVCSSLSWVVMNRALLFLLDTPALMFDFYLQEHRKARWLGQGREGKMLVTNPKLD